MCYIARRQAHQQGSSSAQLLGARFNACFNKAPGCIVVVNYEIKRSASSLHTYWNIQVTFKTETKTVDTSKWLFNVFSLLEKSVFIGGNARAKKEEICLISLCTCWRLRGEQLASVADVVLYALRRMLNNAAAALPYVLVVPRDINREPCPAHKKIPIAFFCDASRIKF